MSRLFFALCLLLGLGVSFQINQVLRPNLKYKEVEGKFGERFLHHNSSDYEEVIYQGQSQPNKQQYKSAFDTILDVSQNPQRQQQFLQCSKGEHSEFFKFGAAYVGYIGNKSEHESILLQRRPDDCFETVIVNFTNKKNYAMNTVEVEIFAIGRNKEMCTETYVFGTGAKFHYHTFSLRRHHKFVWKNMNQVQYNNVITWGIHVFRLCDTTAHWFPNLIKTAEVFVGGLGTNPKIPFFGSKPPKYQQELSVNFVEAGTGFRWKERKPVFMNLTSDEVKPGDFLAITRFDGLDQIIQYGAGSHSGHSAAILEVDGVLSVVESQDGWYWPKHGIQRNDWETWKKEALNADFNVAVLPLSEESRAKFNTTAAEKWFKEKVEGLPYGYHNFLFGWIDTPKDNLPSLLDGDFILAAFGFLERIWPFPIDRIMTQALNKRMGTTGRTIEEITVMMAEKNMTFGDLLSVPERDGWEYSDGESMVCSSFVAALYKAGGLLIDVEGTEMTPKDVYTLTIYDRNFKVPQKCKNNDPTLPYCQIMGNYLMELPGYSSIEQYPHMCEKCPTMTPDFFRPDGC